MFFKDVCFFVLKVVCNDARTNNTGTGAGMASKSSFREPSKERINVKWTLLRIVPTNSKVFLRGV